MNKDPSGAPAVWRRQLLWLPNVLPWLLLVLAVWIVYSHTTRPAGLIFLWSPWALIGALALVMTPIILAGGIDLSIGSVAALAAMVVGVASQRYGADLPVAFAAGVLTGAIAGAINGGLVVMGLAPLVATLATMALFRGCTLALGGVDRISLAKSGIERYEELLGLPTSYWLLAVIACALWVIVHATRTGRYCFAIGDNMEAARYAAVPVKFVQWSLYTLSGSVAGLVAVSYTVSNQAAIPTALKDAELQAIACVVVGGTLITGGSGSVPRTLLGLAVVSLLDLGLQMMGTWTIFGVNVFSAEGRLVLLGVLLIAVSVLNQRTAQMKAV